MDEQKCRFGEHQREGTADPGENAGVGVCVGTPKGIRGGKKEEKANCSSLVGRSLHTRGHTGKAHNGSIGHAYLQPSPAGRGHAGARAMVVEN